MGACATRTHGFRAQEAAQGRRNPAKVRWTPADNQAAALLHRLSGTAGTMHTRHTPHTYTHKQPTSTLTYARHALLLHVHAHIHKAHTHTPHPQGTRSHPQGTRSPCMCTLMHSHAPPRPSAAARPHLPKPPREAHAVSCGGTPPQAVDAVPCSVEACRSGISRQAPPPLLLLVPPWSWCFWRWHAPVRARARALA